MKKIRQTKLIWLCGIQALLITSCSTLTVKNTAITLPAISLAGVTSQGQTGSASIAAGLGSFERMGIYQNALVTPFLKENSNRSVSLGRIVGMGSLGLFESIDIGCVSTTGCFLLFDFSRLGNWRPWVFSIAFNNASDFSNLAVDHSNNRKAQGVLNTRGLVANLGYFINGLDIVYGSLSLRKGSLTTKLLDNISGIELYSESKTIEGFQVLGGFERKRTCKIIGVSSCFTRLEVGFTQYPNQGFEDKEWVSGLGYIAGVQW